MIMFKRLIKRYLLKKLNYAHPKHYHFLRWLAEIVKDEKKTKDVYASIANYMFENDSAQRYLQFSDIFVVDDLVVIYTYRPGLWIGKGGSTMKEIENRLNYNLDGVKVNDYNITFVEEVHSAFADISMNIVVRQKMTDGLY